MKVGLFGCTCDPIHFGHLNLAVEIFEKQKLDAVWLFPTGVNAFKIGASFATKEQRLEMARLAVEDFPMLTVRDDEIVRAGVSYAIDTVTLLQQEYDYEFGIILGEDAAVGLPRWKDVETLLQKVEIYTGTRGQNDVVGALSSHPQIAKAVAKGLTKTRTLEISSTEIRRRIQENLCCRHLLPGKVIDLISQQKLYL